jgi:hypothetical protein
VTENLCTHALAFIAKLSRDIQINDFVHEYFSMDRLKKIYGCTFNPMTSKDRWPRVDLGYKTNKSKLRRKPGRSRNSRIKSYDETSTSKKNRFYSECSELDHTAKHCQESPTASQKKKLLCSQNESSSQTSKRVMHFFAYLVILI